MDRTDITTNGKSGARECGILRGWTGTAGYTLVELSIVLAIVGIVTTMAIPAYLMMQPHLRLKAASMDAASAMQLARITAISKNMPVEVVFNYTNNTFKIYTLPDGVTPTLATNTTVNSDDWKDIDLYSPSPPIADAPSFSGGTIIFKPNGSTNIPLTDEQRAVYMVNTSKKTVSGAERFRIVVKSYTGLVKVQKLQSGGTWE